MRYDPLQWGEPDEVMREAVRKKLKNGERWTSRGWIIESLQSPTLWIRWGDPNSTHEIPLPMKPTTLKKCLERFVRVKRSYENDAHSPWNIENDRLRNIYTDEIIPCAVLV